MVASEMSRGFLFMVEWLVGAVFISANVSFLSRMRHGGMDRYLDGFDGAGI